MTLFYDPFDAAEEDDFLEHEKRRGDRETKKFLHRVDSKDDTLQSQCFDFSMTHEQFESIVDSLSRATFLRSLEISHWGVLLSKESEDLALFLAALSAMKEITHLGMKSCGITGTGIHQIWEFLGSSRILISLDLSRNTLGGIQHEENLVFSFESLSHKFVALKELNLSATGLTSKSIAALLKGLEDNSTLHTLDISHNIDSLHDLLECVAPVLKNMKLRKLVLTKGASSSTCIDAQLKGTLPLLREVEDIIKQNSGLCFFGPIFILPVDKHASKSSQQHYNTCTETLSRTRFYLQRNRIRHTISLINGTTDKLSSFPAHHVAEALAKYNNEPSSMHYLLSEAACFLVG